MPKVRIVVRADSGFCREELMVRCEAENVDYVLGFARNPRIAGRINGSLRGASKLFESTGTAALELE